MLVTMKLVVAQWLSSFWAAAIAGPVEKTFGELSMAVNPSHKG